MTEDGQPWAQEPPVPFSERPKNSDRIWQAAAPEPTRLPTPRVMLTKMFGKGLRGGVNTKAAAEQLGVSQRTVQRWIKDRKIPESMAGQSLKSQHQAWKNSPKGRTAALGRKRLGELKDTKRIGFTGDLRISSDIRRRTNMQVEGFTQDQLDNLLDALAGADDSRAHAALEDLISKSASWGGDVEIRIDKVSFD